MRPESESRSPGFAGRRLWLYLILAVVFLAIIFPVYWMFTISLKMPRDIYRTPSLWPRTVTIDNYRVLIDDKGFLTNIKNSLIVAGTVTFVSVVVSSFAAYSIVRFKYRFRGLIGRLILFAYLTPVSLLFIPLSIIISRMHLANSLFGLIVVYLAFSIPLSTWLLSGYFRGVPADLEEQALVDGSGRLGALFRILLPLSAPGLVAVAIFTFTGAWNELLLALNWIDRQKVKP